MTMRIGMVGLGRMGGNMTRRLLRFDHEVVAHDVSGDVVAVLVGEGAHGAEDLASVVDQLEAPRAVWIMLPAGSITEDAIGQLAGRLSPGDVVIDGGNAHWTDSVTRGQTLADAGVDFCDAGVSGGVWGLENGYGLMVGGEPAVVERLRPLFESLAPEGGYVHVGPIGSGHYAKMVHNGIEYGLMQAYAEGFDLFDKCDFDLDNAKIAHLWNQGSVVRSWLCELAARAFELEGNTLAGLSGYTEDSGEGRWTIEDAMDKDVPTPVITASLYARFYSRANGDFTHRMLAALRAQFGGHATKKSADG